MSGLRFEPVERRTVSSEVRERLVRSIRDGQLLPGHQVPSERALCEQFEVARTSVREAIQGLVSLGVLERRGNRTFVAEALPGLAFDVDGAGRRAQRVRELLEVRRALAGPIARLAATRATDDDRARISDLAARVHAGLRPESFRRLDQDVHRAVAEACGNATLAELHAKVLDALARCPEVDAALADGDTARTLVAGAAAAHRRLAGAIAGGDPAGAAAAAEAHVDEVEAAIVAHLA
jgi:GntR family transcriptional repressor for pyruvate dehydrogenase complex